MFDFRESIKKILNYKVFDSIIYIYKNAYVIINLYKLSLQICKFYNLQI